MATTNQASTEGWEERHMESIHPCIFTIPETLRVERPEAYEPQVVSRLTFQVERKANNGAFQGLVDEIISIAGDIRSCYNEVIECNDEVLGWMMARDAVFLLEILGCHYHGSEPGSEEASLDTVFQPVSKSPLFFPFQADIFKLENQIPHFILRTILEWETGSEIVAWEKLKMATIDACRQFSPFLRVGGFYRPIVGLPYDDADHDSRHLLEWLYNSVVPASFTQNLPNATESHVYVHRYTIFWHITSKLKNSFFPVSLHKTDANLPTASELHRKGVKFAPITLASEHIRFDSANATLFLPCIEMDYRTDVFLRNLIAVEAYNKRTTRPFPCYVYLIDGLVDNPKDVAVLKKHGIIYSELGSDKEVSNMWNGICKSIWKSAFELIDQTIKDVNAYYRTKYKVMMGEFMQEHFSKPWRAASVMGACILLLLALLQTLCSCLLHSKQ